MNEELREELYNYMIQNYNELSHDEIIDTLDILEKLEFEEYLYKDNDYLYDQIDNIIEETTWLIGDFVKYLKDYE